MNISFNNEVETEVETRVHILAYQKDTKNLVLTHFCFSDMFISHLNKLNRHFLSLLIICFHGLAQKSL